MDADLDNLIAQARAEAGAAGTRTALEDVRIGLLGRNAPLSGRLRGIGALPPDQRGPVGKRLNEVRVAIEGVLSERERELARSELAAQLATERIDVTLPGRPTPRGGLHVLTQVRREIEDAFMGLGYRIAEGPEVELEYNNFTALNIPDDHPAKGETDTLWVRDGVCLRTHTSPVQARELRSSTPPLYIICPGRTYRRDTPDATHSAIFHQVEGLAVDRGVTLADLKGTLQHFARVLFGPDREVRLRSHFFPFTEPSVELDVTCFRCIETIDPACRVCKGTGWIELLGAGQVHPNVIAMAGHDPDVWQGFAFGLGIERVAMLRHGIPDVRMLYDNDLRFSLQFPS